MKTLADFPTEILQHIFSLLGPNCAVSSNPAEIIWPRYCPWEDADFKCDKKDLINLTLVCKKFQHIAQPLSVQHFHHLPPATDNENEELRLRPRLFRFFNLLRARSDLRAAVKLVDIDATERLPLHDDETAGDHWLARDALQNEEDRYLKELEKKVEGHEDEEDDDYCPIHPDGPHGFVESVEEALLQFILLMLSGSLRDLRLVLPRRWVLPKMRDRWLQVKKLRSEVARGRMKLNDEERRRFALFDNLQRLLVHVGPIQQYACTPDHDGQCSEYNPEHPVENLLINVMAPSLRLLSCMGSAFVYQRRLKPPNFPRLTHLNICMNGWWFGDTLKRLFADCLPALTHFAYESINEHAPKPRDVQTLLVEYQKDTLEYCSFSMQRSMEAVAKLIDGGPRGISLWAPPTDKEYLVGPFVEFTKLKTLAVDDFMIWAEDDEDGRPISWDYDGLPVPYLVASLPTSIENVVVTQMGKVGETDIWQVARAMMEGKLPNLRQVILGHTRRSSMKVLDARDKGKVHWEVAWPYADPAVNARARRKERYLHIVFGMGGVWDFRQWKDRMFPDLSVWAVGRRICSSPVGR